ncbi:hypothetical protein F4810DRAFT_676695 [Camillea tinctor]|nr:hypothetical protein F4810DRAFT_676695 [Camillea tinctor]
MVSRRYWNNSRRGMPTASSRRTMQAIIPMEDGLEQDEAPKREALLRDLGNALKEDATDACVENSLASPDNNSLAQPNLEPPSVDQDEFPTLTAAASIRTSKRGRRQQRPPVPTEFRVERSPQGINIPVSSSPTTSASSASNRSWADVVNPLGSSLPTKDSKLRTPILLSISRPSRSSTNSLPFGLVSGQDPTVQPDIRDSLTGELSHTSGTTSSSHSPIVAPHGRQRTHSLPSQYPNKPGYHTRQGSPIERPRTTICIPGSSGVPAVSNGFHMYSANHPTNRTFSSTSKKSLNVDSPSFTPAQLGAKKSNFSTNATPFTPRAAAASTNPPLQQDPGASLFKSSPFPEFAPQNNYDLNTVVCLEV